MKDRLNKIFIIIIKYFNTFLEPNGNEIKYNVNKYYQIIEKFGDYELLNKIDLDYLNSLPQKKLVNIINI